jgi:hypothetical protein
MILTFYEPYGFRRLPLDVILDWRLQANALIEPDRARFSHSGRIVAYSDRTALLGRYFRIAGNTPGTA